MLDETIILSFSDDGVVPASAKTLKKRAHENLSALYRNSVTIDDPGLPEERFLLGINPAKATANFYGTRRTTVNYRHNRTVPVPGGTSVYPVVFKVEVSIPIGVSAAQIEYDLGAFRAFVAHDVFKRLVKTQET